MSKWISGEELLDNFDIKGIELLKFVTDGLQPYNQVGKPTPPPAIKIKFAELDRLKKRLAELNEFSKFSDPRPIIRYRRSQAAKTHEDEIHELNEKIALLEQELSNPTAITWANYIAADSEEEVEKIINFLASSLYKSEDVSTLKNSIAIQRDSKIIKIIKAVKPELESVYSAIREVGFSSELQEPEERWKKAALKRIKQNRSFFKILTEKDLTDKKIYRLNGGQERRDFIGNILKQIVLRSDLGPVGYQRLFRLYNKI
jgi:hypothetical protein